MPHAVNQPQPSNIDPAFSTTDLTSHEFKKILLS